MQTFNFPTKNKETILALGAESAGNFSVSFPLPCLPRQNNSDWGTQGRAARPPRYAKRCGRGERLGRIHLSQDFGDLLDENNFNNFKKSILNFLKKNLHPLMKTTLWGKELSKKYKAKFIQVQHHHAHIFSQIKPLPLGKGEVGRGFENLPATFYGDCPVKHDSVFYGTCPVIAKQFYGVAMDGTGYGYDEKIWGGECFEISNKFQKSKLQNKKIMIERIGSLEDQIMIGGELATQEPARMIISILSKLLPKNKIYPFVKKYYTKNEFELLYNQLEQNFNCVETSSTGRILDAVSLLLGFCGNERKYKHEAITLLEANSTKPYKHPLPLIDRVSHIALAVAQGEMSEGQRGCYKLNTTYLFKYLINNLHKDKKRLAATAQLYIAKGLHEIIQKHINHPLPLIEGGDLPAGRQVSEGQRGWLKIVSSGGLSNNKIISDYFTSKNIYLNNTIPRGDAGLSFGQIVYFLFK
ncbi:MAG: (NiFe) hydrogenase maturation protein HypF [Candidatus Moranbacteria bacterium GW2011_GWF2_35_54]|nr:MAG: (NiFe) hydrogenase maturation protein HypF [Candidatus Moranbacteria bacterium GW2011_GWF2_35_54]